MELTTKKRSRVLSFVYRGLVIFLVFLGIILIGGTIYGVFFHTPLVGDNQINSSQNNEKGQTFTGIGTIRVSTNDPQPAMVILFVSFEYYPNDKMFSEELVLRIGDFRRIIVNYIGSFSTVELRKTNEESLKTELLHRFNAILRLGQIESLYFSDFMIVG